MAKKKWQPRSYITQFSNPVKNKDDAKDKTDKPKLDKKATAK